MTKNVHYISMTYNGFFEYHKHLLAQYMPKKIMNIFLLFFWKSNLFFNLLFKSDAAAGSQSPPSARRACAKTQETGSLSKHGPHGGTWYRKWTASCMIINNVIYNINMLMFVRHSQSTQNLIMNSWLPHNNSYEVSMGSAWGHQEVLHRLGFLVFVLY